jgi:hypothetical protein
MLCGRLKSEQLVKIYDLDSPGVPVRKWTELENVRQYYEFFRDRNEEFV